MFEKPSRYYKLPDEVITDHAGRKNEVKSLRLLPEVAGEILHTVEEGDRLDRIAYRYYRNTRKWWRICDANPGVLFPPALLGKDVAATYRIPVESQDPEPCWPDLLHALAGMVGVEQVSAGTPEQPYPETKRLTGALLFTVDRGLSTDLSTAVRTQELTAPLRAALESKGLVFLATVGVYSPGPGHWRIDDHLRKLSYVLSVVEEALNVYESIAHHEWTITATLNTLNRTTQDVVSRIVTLGFGAGAPQQIGRIGKRVVIPADSVR